MEPFWTGVLAGYGIAIPVGAIAVLIVEVGIRCGFRCAFFAGAGAATADLAYSALAVAGGVGLATMVGGVRDEMRLAGGLALAVIAVIGLRRAGRRSRPDATTMVIPSRRDYLPTFARFLGLTIINPATVVYFAAFVVGLGVASRLEPAQGAMFAAGAFLASLSWQTILAAVGALAGRRLPPRVQTLAIILGNLIILAVAGAVLIG